MYCPNCGQQQLSEEMRFCSRCGLALTGLAEWLAGGGLPAVRAAEIQPSTTDSPRRKGIRRAAKVMFFSGVLFPVFLVISLALEEGGPMILPSIVFFVGLVMMLYARLFSDKYPTPNSLSGQQQTSLVSGPSVRSALPPVTNVNIPPVGRTQVRTNELAQPASVTEHTTRLLDNE